MGQSTALTQFFGLTIRRATFATFDGLFDMSPDRDPLDLQAEFRELVGQSLMTPHPQIDRDPPLPQIGHEIERIMSSVARLTSSSIQGLENLTSELHDLQTFLQTEVARVQSEVDNAMAGIKIIMEAIAPLRGLQTSGTAGRIIRSGPAANIGAPSHQAPALTPSAETLKPKPE